MEIKPFKQTEKKQREEVLRDIKSIFTEFSYNTEMMAFLPTLGYLCHKFSINQEELLEYIGKENLERASMNLTKINKSFKPSYIG